MSPEVSYDRQTIDSPNPFARSAHRFRHSYGIDTLTAASPVGGLVADFGAGTGALLQSVADRRPDLALVAIEPLMEVKDFEGRVVTSLNELDDHSIDVLSAFEVCEHLTDEQLDQFLIDADRVMTTNGQLIVSVPIMLGPVVLLKESNRAWLHRRAPDYSMRELARAVVGLSVPRPDDRGPTHKGFDFRKLDQLIQESFERSSLETSPLRRLPWWVNSQVFMTYQVVRPSSD